VLDYLKQQISCGIELELAGFKNDWVLNYKDRVGSSPVAIVDTRIRKNVFTKSGVSLDAYFEIANLCNTPYSEVKNVAMPGRWIKSGARLKF
jgi:hypothetical protein